MKKIVLIITILLLWNCKKQVQKVNNTIAVQPKTVQSNFKRIDLSTYNFNTLSGKTKNITLEKGKKYLLDFWYIECAPCVRDHKIIQKKYKELQDKNIEVIGLSIDKSRKKWKDYIASHAYNWQQYNQYSQKPNLKEHLKIKLFPRYFLINDNGVIQKETGSLAKMLDYLRIQ